MQKLIAYHLKVGVKIHYQQKTENLLCILAVHLHENSVLGDLKTQAFENGFKLKHSKC